MQDREIINKRMHESLGNQTITFLKKPLNNTVRGCHFLSTNICMKLKQLNILNLYTVSYFSTNRYFSCIVAQRMRT